MTQYIARTRIMHDGVTYEEGNTIALPEAVAGPLLRVGAVTESAEPVADEAASGAAETKKKKKD